MKCETCGSTQPLNDEGLCPDCGSKPLSKGDAVVAPEPVDAVPSKPAPMFPAVPSAADLHVDVRQCPDCGGHRKGNARFCIVCRYDYALMKAGAAKINDSAPSSVASSADQVPAPGTSKPSVRGLRAVITVDPEHFERCKKVYEGLEDLKLPEPLPMPEMFHVKEDVVMVGRQSHKLNVQPTVLANLDTGVSRRHCKFVLQSDGTYSVFDGEETEGNPDYVCDSTGGTLLNGTAVPKGTLTPVKVGDVLHIGFWTRIDLQAL